MVEKSIPETVVVARVTAERQERRADEWQSWFVPEMAACLSTILRTTLRPRPLCPEKHSPQHKNPPTAKILPLTKAAMSVKLYISPFLKEIFLRKKDGRTFSVWNNMKKKK